jgi:PAT family beta-lactamase induction signal transducer AmpG
MRRLTCFAPGAVRRAADARQLRFLRAGPGWTGTPALLTAIGLENFFSGMGSAAFVALLMALTDARTARRSSRLFTALDSIGRTSSARWRGSVAQDYGWSAYWALSLAFGAPGLWLLWL